MNQFGQALRDQRIRRRGGNMLAFRHADGAGVPNAIGFLFLAHAASIRTGGWIVKVLSTRQETVSTA